MPHYSKKYICRMTRSSYIAEAEEAMDMHEFHREWRLSVPDTVATRKRACRDRKAHQRTIDRTADAQWKEQINAEATPKDWFPKAREAAVNAVVRPFVSAMARPAVQAQLVKFPNLTVGGGRLAPMTSFCQTRGRDRALRNGHGLLCAYFGCGGWCRNGITCCFLHLKSLRPTVSPQRRRIEKVVPYESLVESSRFSVLFDVDSEDESTDNGSIGGGDAQTTLDLDELTTTADVKGMIRVFVTGLASHVNESVLLLAIEPINAKVRLDTDVAFGWCLGSGSLRIRRVHAEEVVAKCVERGWNATF